jgi:predicted outer membrane protein
MKNTFRLSLIVIIIAGFCACSRSGKNASADSTSVNNSGKQPIDTADTRLANDLSVFCTSQVNMAQLAEKKASTQKVKDFAKQSVELYTRLNTKLNLVSESYDIKLPAELTPAAKENFEHLSAIKEASFDHAYLLQMLKLHNAMIREYNAAKNIQCVPLKMFVASNQGDIIKNAYALSDLKDQTP